MNLFQLIPSDIVKDHILPYCDHSELQLEYNTVNYVHKNPSLFKRITHQITNGGDNGTYLYTLSVEEKYYGWSRYIIDLFCVFCVFCGNYKHTNVVNSKIKCNCQPT